MSNNKPSGLLENSGSKNTSMQEITKFVGDSVTDIMTKEEIEIEIEIEKKKKEFSMIALKTLNSIFFENSEIDSYSLNCLELSIYMMIFSKIHDNQDKISLSDEIVGNCYIPDHKREGIYENNPELGKPYFHKNSKIRKSLINIYKNQRENKEYKKKFCEEIIKYTRNAIMHGNFIVNINDDLNIVNIWKKFRRDNAENYGETEFRMKYDFECLIYICKTLIKKEEIEYYKKILDYIEEIKKDNGISSTISIKDDKSLYFDCLINILISYNQPYFYHNIQRISNSYKILSEEFIKHARNSVVHGHRRLIDEEDTIRIIDYNKKGKISADFNVNFSDIEQLGKNFNFN